MSSLFSALIITIAFISNARAEVLTKIENANLVCSSSGGAIFVNSTAKRLWQTDDATETEGLELKVSTFNIARCPNCYTVEGQFEGFEANQSLRYAISGKQGSFTEAKLVISSIEGTEVSEVLKMDCKTIPAAPVAETWGGKHVELTVKGESASFDFDCASGSVQTGWKKNSKGIISAKGTTVSLGGGPTRPGQPARAPVATEFTAKIKGSKMTLTLKSATGKTTYKLVKGAAAELFRCL